VLPERGLRIILLLCGFTALVACDDAARSVAPAATSAATSTASAEPTGRRDFLARRQQRCVLYWVRGETIGQEKAVMCPRELEQGERLELAGKTCMRHSTDPDRRVPTRCPKELLAAPASSVAP
jgi:hypothetical protein